MQCRHTILICEKDFSVFQAIKRAIERSEVLRQPSLSDQKHYRVEAFNAGQTSSPIVPEDTSLILLNLDSAITSDQTGLILRCLSPIGTPLVYYSFRRLKLDSGTKWFCADTDLLLRAPFLISDLLSAIETAQTCQPKITAPIVRCYMNSLLAKLELLYRNKRHKHRNVIASLRLLFGALSAGDIEPGNINATLEKLRVAKENSSGLLSRLAEKLLLVQKSYHHLLAGAGEYISVPARAAKGKILIVDDQLLPGNEAGTLKGGLGWQAVYDAILCSNRRFDFDIHYASSYEGAIEQISEMEIDDLELAILDIDLGLESGDNSGLHILDRIRRANPYTPVMMMTSFDEAEISQLAFEMQADAYFAKELNDDTDRSSYDYYRKFLETVETLQTTAARERRLYREFKKRVPTIVAQDRKIPWKAGPEYGMTGKLTKLFLLLRATELHYTGQALLLNSPLKGSDDSWDALLIVLADALLARLNWDTTTAGPIESLQHWREICSFYVDKYGRILEQQWSERGDARTSPTEFYEYDVSEVAGQPMSMLWQDSSYVPALSPAKPLIYFSNREHRKKSGKTFKLDLKIERLDRPQSDTYRITLLVPKASEGDLNQLVNRMISYQGIRHSQLSRKVTKNVILDLLETLLMQVPLAEEAFSGRGGGRDNSRVLHKVPGVIRRMRKRDRALRSFNHAVKSNMGAEALMLGAYLNAEAPVDRKDWDKISKGIFLDLGADFDASEVIYTIEGACEDRGLAVKICDKPERLTQVVLIDDQGFDNGWAYVTQVVLNDIRIKCLQFDGPEDGDLHSYVASFKPLLMQADLILLDLMMPESRASEPKLEVGLEVAKILRQFDPVTPVILLSAHQDSLLIKKAIKAGATDFFPKEIPPVSAQAEFIDYCDRFAGIKRDALLFDKGLIEEREKLKWALYDLERLLKECKSGGKSMPRLFEQLILHPSRSKGAYHLAKCLRLSATIDEAKLREAVAGQILWLCRRTAFFWLLSKERYLREWPGYFCNSENHLPETFLGYDQVWLDCAAIVEFLFNVIAVAGGFADEFETPGKRESKARARAGEIDAIKSYCDYEAGQEIWAGRNERRYGHHLDPSVEPGLAWEVLNKTIIFLQSAGLVSPRILTCANNDLDPLRANLAESQRRASMLVDYLTCLRNIEKVSKQLSAAKSTSGKLNKIIVTLAEKKNALEAGLERANNLEEILKKRWEIVTNLVR